MTPRLRGEDDWDAAGRQNRQMVALAVAVGAAIGIPALACVAYFAWPTHPVVGTIESASWSHTVTLERWVDVSREDWCQNVWQRSEISPVRGQGERAGINVTWRQRKLYTTHYREVCTGTGDLRRCHMEADPEYRDWCTYTTQKWRAADHQTLTGQGLDRKWPVYASLADDERSVQSGVWTLMVHHSERAHSVPFGLASEAQYVVILEADSSRCILDLRPGGAIYDVHPFAYESGS